MVQTDDNAALLVSAIDVSMRFDGHTIRAHTSWAVHDEWNQDALRIRTPVDRVETVHFKRLSNPVPRGVFESVERKQMVWTRVPRLAR